MTTNKSRKMRNNKQFHRCEYCSKLCTCKFIHIDCIIDYLKQHNYFVIDYDVDRVFGGRI